MRHDMELDGRELLAGAKPSVDLRRLAEQRGVLPSGVCYGAPDDAGGMARHDRGERALGRRRWAHLWAVSFPQPAKGMGTAINRMQRR